MSALHTSVLLVGGIKVKVFVLIKLTVFKHLSFTIPHRQALQLRAEPPIRLAKVALS